MTGFQDEGATSAQERSSELSDEQIRSLIQVRGGMLKSLGRGEDEPVVAAEGLAAQLAGDAVLTALTTTVREPDPALRARALTGFLVDVQQLIDLLSSVRNDAIRELRTERRSSYDDVAELLGISKSRAQQLCKRLETSS